MDWVTALLSAARTGQGQEGRAVCLYLPATSTECQREPGPVLGVLLLASLVAP